MINLKAERHFVPLQLDFISQNEREDSQRLIKNTAKAAYPEAAQWRLDMVERIWIIFSLALRPHFSGHHQLTSFLIKTSQVRLKPTEIISKLQDSICSSKAFQVNAIKLRVWSIQDKGELRTNSVLLLVLLTIERIVSIATSPYMAPGSPEDLFRIWLRLGINSNWFVKTPSIKLIFLTPGPGQIGECTQ